MTTPAAISSGTVTEAIVPNRRPSAAASLRLPAARLLSGARMPIQKAAAARCTNNNASSQIDPVSATCPTRQNDQSASMPPAPATHTPRPGSQTPPSSRARPAARRTRAVPTGVCHRRPSISGSVIPDASPVIAAPVSAKPSPAARSARIASADACRRNVPCIRPVSRPNTARASTSPALPNTPI